MVDGADEKRSNSTPRCPFHPQATPRGNMHLSWLIGVAVLVLIAHPATSFIITHPATPTTSSPEDDMKFEYYFRFIRDDDTEAKPCRESCIAYYSEDFNEERCFCEGKHLNNNKLETNSTDADIITEALNAPGEIIKFKTYRRIEQMFADNRAYAKSHTGRN
ncbi:unnamed protein product [Caenorhabditis nigoni]